jgi:hypothetical protein
LYGPWRLIPIVDGEGKAGLDQNSGRGQGVEGTALAELAAFGMPLDGHAQTKDIPDDIGARGADPAQGFHGRPDMVAGMQDPK